MVLFPFVFHIIFSISVLYSALLSNLFCSKTLLLWITSASIHNIPYSISVLILFFLTILFVSICLQFYPHYPHSYPQLCCHAVNNFHFINFINQLPFKTCRMPKKGDVLPEKFLYATEMRPWTIIEAVAEIIVRLGAHRSS